MPLFDYTAIDAMGRPQAGQRTALTPEEVATQLQYEDMIPLDITPAKKIEKKATIHHSRLNIFKEKVSKDALHMFCRQMYAVLKAGIPVGSAVGRLAETTQDKTLKRTLQHVMENLEQGRSLNVSLSQCPDVFSAFFVNLVKVGENTGQLNEVFLHLAQYLELETDTIKKFKTVLRYPSMVLVTIVVALLVINAFVIPAFSNMFESFRAQLPLPTRILIASSRFILSYWHVMVGVVVVATIAFHRYVHTSQGEFNWSKLQLKIPVVGWLLHRIWLVRFARLYALVLRAGLTALTGIELVAASTGNAYVTKKIIAVAALISRGHSISTAIGETGLFPPLIVQMITIGEETGSIEALLDDVADFYQREVDYDLRRLSDAIEPIVLVILGAMVLILALGVFLPMWSLASQAMHQH